MYSYPVILSPVEDGQYMAEFPDIPEALSYGKTKEEALLWAEDALHEALDQYMSMRQDIPRPSLNLTTMLNVNLTPMIGIKLCVYQTMREQGITQDKLAKLLSCDPKQVRRLLDIFHNSTLEQLTTVLEVLGYRLEMTAKPIFA